MMVSNSLGTLGVVGTRRGDFGSILGLTPADALKRAEAAKKVRETRKKNKKITVEAEQKLLNKELNAEPEPDDEPEPVTKPMDTSSRARGWWGTTTLATQLNSMSLNSSSHAWWKR
jgi:hypothetical protein